MQHKKSNGKNTKKKMSKTRNLNKKLKKNFVINDERQFYQYLVNIIITSYFHHNY